MKTVIRKTRFASFMGQFVLVLLVGGIGIGGIYLGTSDLMKDAGLLFRSAFLIGGVCACVATFFTLRTALGYLKAPSDWVVEITDDQLKWSSAAEHLQPSFQVALSEIERVELLIRRDDGRSEGRGPREATNSIYLKSGETIVVREDISGIWPHRVFKALAKRGIEYSQESVGDLSYISRTKPEMRETVERLREHREARRRDPRVIGPEE